MFGMYFKVRHQVKLGTQKWFIMYACYQKTSAFHYTIVQLHGNGKLLPPVLETIAPKKNMHIQFCHPSRIGKTMSLPMPCFGFGLSMAGF